MTAALRRAWRRPLWVHAAALAVVLVVSLLAIGPHVAFSSDEGVAVIQARMLRDGHGWLYRYPLASMDPRGDARPFEHGDLGSMGVAPYAKHPTYPLLLAGFDLIGGFWAMLGVGLAGTVAAAGLGALIVRRLDPRLDRTVLWLLGLGSPLFFDGFVVLAHTLAAAAVAGAVLAALTALGPRRTRARRAAAVAGLAAGLVVASLLRTEAIFVGPALAVAVGVGVLAHQLRPAPRRGGGRGRGGCQRGGLGHRPAGLARHPGHADVGGAAVGGQLVGGRPMAVAAHHMAPGQLPGRRHQRRRPGPVRRAVAGRRPDSARTQRPQPVGGGRDGRRGGLLGGAIRGRTARRGARAGPGLPGRVVLPVGRGTRGPPGPRCRDPGRDQRAGRAGGGWNAVRHRRRRRVGRPLLRRDPAGCGAPAGLRGRSRDPSPRAGPGPPDRGRARGAQRPGVAHRAAGAAGVAPRHRGRARRGAGGRGPRRRRARSGPAGGGHVEPTGAPDRLPRLRAVRVGGDRSPEPGPLRRRARPDGASTGSCWCHRTRLRIWPACQAGMWWPATLD